MPQYANINGVWKESSQKYVNINGVWRSAVDEYVNINGVWRSYGAKPGGLMNRYDIPNSGYECYQELSVNSDGLLVVSGEIYRDSRYYTNARVIQNMSTVIASVSSYSGTSNTYYYKYLANEKSPYIYSVPVRSGKYLTSYTISDGTLKQYNYTRGLNGTFDDFYDTGLVNVGNDVYLVGMEMWNDYRYFTMLKNGVPHIQNKEVRANIWRSESEIINTDDAGRIIFEGPNGFAVDTNGNVVSTYLAERLGYNTHAIGFHGNKNGMTVHNSIRLNTTTYYPSSYFYIYKNGVLLQNFSFDYTKKFYVTDKYFIVMSRGYSSSSNGAHFYSIDSAGKFTKVLLVESPNIRDILVYNNTLYVLYSTYLSNGGNSTYIEQYHIGQL